jgi:hypothetical protein
MIDKDFPNPRKKSKELKIYCQQHPYYFIDKLRHELVVNLFCQQLEDRLDLLIHVAQKVKTEDLDSIEHYLNKALALEYTPPLPSRSKVERLYLFLFDQLKTLYIYISLKIY